MGVKLSKSEHTIYSNEELKVTNKRVILSDEDTYYQDIQLSSIESVEFNKKSKPIFIALAVFAIIGSLWLFIDYYPGLGVLCLLIAGALIAGYFITKKESVKIIGSNSSMNLDNESWKLVEAIRYNGK
jgi:hypothetical protein